MKIDRHAVSALLYLCMLMGSLGFLAVPAAAQTHDTHVHQHPMAQAVQQSGFFGDLLKTYTPRLVCMNREQPVIWLHLISDGIIALAYFTIPIALVKFVRGRNDLAFHWIFVCFAVFILACGLTHVMNVVAIWTPVYRVDGLVKAVTAAASIGTAIALWKLIPAALLLPSPSQLRVTNEHLQHEISERRLAEQRLQGAHDELEARVLARTIELTNAHARERDARAEAERAGRMKDEFLATLSHELRTPLHAILGWSQIMRRTSGDPQSIAEGAETIERNARAQAQIIDDLLDMSRIVSGKIQLDMRQISLAQVVEAAIETVRATADNKGVSIKFDNAAGEQVAVKGDANRLQQVFWNLLSNAIKFTPRGGHIALRIGSNDTFRSVEVCDDGEGISPDFLPFVFDRFRQADASITRRHGGLGLGLAIVKQLVEAHGGEVAITSDGVGRGTCASVTLPAADSGSQGVHVGVTEQTAASAPFVGSAIGMDVALCESVRGLKILIVDDEADARALLRRLLSDCGCEVLVAERAEQAIEMLQEARPDILISDIGMPGMDGYELITSVRALPADRGGSVPAIALTAYARAEDRVKAIRSGFQSHVPKPVEPTELLTMIASLAVRRPK